MKKATVWILCLLFALGCFTGCGNDVITNPVIPAGYTEYAVRESSGRKTEGYGCQIDTHLYKSYNAMTDEELQMTYDRALEMNVQNIRTQVFPEWYERGNDNGDYDLFDYESPNVKMDSAEMQQLFRLLDFCEENEILVDLSFYGCNINFQSEDGEIDGSWLGAPFTNNWITAPKLKDESGNAFPGYEEYAETVYGLLNYVLNVKKYTCVTEFSVYPEPNLAFVGADGKVTHSEYVKLCKAVDEKLKKEGIRDQIDYSGPASAVQKVTEFQAYIDDLDCVYDKYTASTYCFNATDTNENYADFASSLSWMTDEVGKSVGIAEFGSDYIIDPANQTDIDTYERALFLARYMICLTNNGCTSMKYWVLNDIMYGTFLMRLGLWQFRNGDWKARPQYYTWSLICKYTEVGSEIFPIHSEDGDVCGVAFLLPDQSWTYLFCNSGDSSQKVSLVNYNRGYPKSMNVYEVRESILDGTCKPIQSSETLQIADGAVNYTLKANSFVVFSTK